MNFIERWYLKSKPDYCEVCGRYCKERLVPCKYDRYTGEVTLYELTAKCEMSINPDTDNHTNWSMMLSPQDASDLGWDV